MFYRLFSPSFDFTVGRAPPPATDVKADKIPWYEYLNPFKARKPDALEGQESVEVQDSIALIPLPAKHKPAYLQLVTPVRSAGGPKPQIELHSIEAPGPVVEKPSYDQGSLLPPAGKPKTKGKDMVSARGSKRRPLMRPSPGVGPAALAPNTSCISCCKVVAE